MTGRGRRFAALLILAAAITGVGLGAPRPAAAAGSGVPGWPALPADPGPIPPATAAAQLGPAKTTAGLGPKFTVPAQPRARPAPVIPPPIWWAAGPKRPLSELQPRYGFSDAGGAFLSYAGSPAFRGLAQEMDAHGRGLDYVRLAAPYDTLGSYNPASQKCTWSLDFTSHDDGGAGSAWDTLLAEMRAVTADGMTPELEVNGPTADGAAGGGGLPQEPRTPEATYGTAGAPQAGYTQAALDYSCGLAYLTYYVQAQAPRLHYTAPEGIEAWNEPDGSIQATTVSSPGNAGGYNGILQGACASQPNTTLDPTVPPRINECGGTIADTGGALCGSPIRRFCGPLEAAWLWEDAEAWSEYWAAHSTLGVLPIVALTEARPENGAWTSAYLSALTAMGQCRAGYLCFAGAAPAVYGVHDYDDPTSGSTADADLKAFDAQITAQAPAPATIWVTEAAIGLTDHSRDRNRPRGCPGAFDGARGLAGCVDGRPAAQASGAEAFLDFGAAGAEGTPVTEAFWFELQPANGSTGFDSGLLAPPAAGGYAQVAPDGVSGDEQALRGLRASYCVLAGLPDAACTGSLVAASPWSVAPRFFTAVLTRGSRRVTDVEPVPGGGALADVHRSEWVTSALAGSRSAGIPAGTQIRRIVRPHLSRPRRHHPVQPIGEQWILTRPATVSGTVGLTISGIT